MRKRKGGWAQCKKKHVVNAEMSLIGAFFKEREQRRKEQDRGEKGREKKEVMVEGAGEITQWLRILYDHLEDQSAIPSIHFGWLTTVYDSNSKVPDALFQLPCAHPLSYMPPPKTNKMKTDFLKFFICIGV